MTVPNRHGSHRRETRVNWTFEFPKTEDDHMISALDAQTRTSHARTSTKAALPCVTTHGGTAAHDAARGTAVAPRGRHQRVRSGQIRARHQAILVSFDLGLTTSATIMANMPEFADACAAISTHKFQDRIGVHLNLTGASAIRLTRNCGPSPGLARRIYKTAFNTRLARGDLAPTRHFGSAEDAAWLVRFAGPVEIMVHPSLDNGGRLVDLTPGARRLEDVAAHWRPAIHHMHLRSQ
jgi:hypothetical protein